MPDAERADGVATAPRHPVFAAMPKKARQCITLHLESLGELVQMGILGPTQFHDLENAHRHLPGPHGYRLSAYPTNSLRTGWMRLKTHRKLTPAVPHMSPWSARCEAMAMAAPSRKAFGAMAFNGLACVQPRHDMEMGSGVA